MWPYTKKFNDLKTFDEWLQHKKESNEFDPYFICGMLLFVVAAFCLVTGYNAGMADKVNPSEIACSAVGMELASNQTTLYYANDFCVDARGVFHKVLINDGKVYIDK